MSFNIINYKKKRFDILKKQKNNQNLKNCNIDNDNKICKLNNLKKINISTKNNKKENNKKIIISSTQFPGYGGAATNAYYIIKYLRSKNYQTLGLFFFNDDKIEGKDIDFDPDKIGGIILSKYPQYNSEEVNNNIKDQIINYLGREPDICMGKNYAAPVYCKELFPKSYIIYLVSGINHMPLFYAKKGLCAHDILKDDFKIVEKIPREIKCNELSDLIVLNSKLSYDVFMKIYPEFKNKIYKIPIDTTQYSNVSSISEEFNNLLNIKIRGDFKISIKKFDILICSSNLERIDKNNTFLIDILKNKVFDKYTKCIIGTNNDRFLNIKNSTCVGLISNNEVIEYMIKSKILLFPTLFDANSNTVREAYNNSCIPLISNNLGYYNLFPEYLLCNHFDNDLWTSKILFILNNYKYFFKKIIKNKIINFNKDTKNSITDILKI